MRRSAQVLAVALILGLAASAHAKPKEGGWVLGESRKSGQYTFRSFVRYGGSGGYFEILKNGKRIYTKKGGCHVVDLRAGNKEALMGRDLTDNGQPDLVVHEFGNGAHGPYYSYVFEIGSEFRRIATINGEHDAPRFDDLDHDGDYEVILNDWTLAYWHASFAASPAPDVILRYEGGKYVAALDLMHRPLPSATSLDKKLPAIRSALRRMVRYPNDDPQGDPPSELWGTMLDLIYTGHPEAAHSFFARAWPIEVPGRMRFIEDFRAQLHKSPHWPAIKAANPGKF